jgi:hypothetical protein
MDIGHLNPLRPGRLNVQISNRRTADSAHLILNPRSRLTGFKVASFQSVEGSYKMEISASHYSIEAEIARDSTCGLFLPVLSYIKA